MFQLIWYVREIQSVQQTHTQKIHYPNATREKVPCLVQSLKLVSEPQHLDLAEIQFTLLVGSMIEWGGFNPTAAGGHKADSNAALRLDDAKTQAIVELPWASENLDHSTTVISKRVKALQSATELLQSDQEYKVIEDHLNDGKAMLDRRTKAIEEGKRAIDTVRTATKALQEHDSRVSGVAAKKQAYLNFADDVEKWLNG